ncbi:MAG: hypothetical protein MI919_22530 [Holophagales bacterium]|nr:hypothetical protein [Holophagales bacterium]
MALYRFFIKEILVGAAVAGAAFKVARPVLTAAVGAGIVAKDVAQHHWGKAMGELLEVVGDAQAARTSSLSSRSGPAEHRATPAGGSTSKAK